jgi:SAM-dependent methyltransferase
MGAKELESVISKLANNTLKGRTNLKLLEAGCGSTSYFHFANIVRSVGIDTSKEELDQNTFVKEKILGDIQVYPLAREEFDIVVCWDVLEHLSRPRDALLNLFNTIKPGGVLILGFPNLLSFKGLMTKITPFSFHKLFYYWMNYKSPPLPTYLRMAILPRRIIKFARVHTFVVILNKLREGGVTKRFKERSGLIRVFLAAINTVFRVASFGKCESLYLDNCTLVLRKQPK